VKTTTETEKTTIEEKPTIETSVTVEEAILESPTITEKTEQQNYIVIVYHRVYLNIF
jgi:hypothetical protein